jgi:hypothetical protein
MKVVEDHGMVGNVAVNDNGKVQGQSDLMLWAAAPGTLCLVLVTCRRGDNLLAIRHPRCY